MTPPARTGSTVQLTVRVEFAFADRLDALAVKLSRPGLELGRADVMRMALVEGVQKLEAEAKRK